MNKALELAKSLIKEFENCSLKAYRCPAGIPTIGWGHTDGVKMGDVWTQEKADKVLDDEVAQYMRGVLKVSPNLEHRPECLAAVTSFAYNVGLGDYRKSSMCRKIKEGDWDGASDEFPRWKYSKGKVLNGLVRRRAAEQALFRKGY